MRFLLPSGHRGGGPGSGSATAQRRPRPCGCPARRLPGHRTLELSACQWQHTSPENSAPAGGSGANFSGATETDPRIVSTHTISPTNGQLADRGLGAEPSSSVGGLEALDGQPSIRHRNRGREAHSSGLWPFPSAGAAPGRHCLQAASPPRPRAPPPPTGAPLTCGLAEEVEGPQGVHLLGLVAEEGWQQGNGQAAVRPRGRGRPGASGRGSGAGAPTGQGGGPRRREGHR